MKKHLPARLLSLLLVLSLLCGYMVPISAAHVHSNEEALTFHQVDNSTVNHALLSEEAVEPTQEEPYTATDEVRVSIILNGKSTIEAGYSTLDIAGNVEAMAYRSGLAQQQEQITAQIQSTLGEDLDVRWNLTLAVNLISANVMYGQIETIKAVPGVQEVVIENCYHPAVVDEDLPANPNMATSSNQIGSGLAWANGYTGAGGRVAIIDTGVDSDHQSLSESGYQYSLAYQAGLADMTIEEYVDALNLLDVKEIASVLDKLNRQGLDAESLYVNSKIPFGYNYVDADYDITHDNDYQGEHGSHVTGIAAANAFIQCEDGNFVRALDTVKVQGVAPDAQIIAMKVFGKNGGAYESDYMAAIEDAIILGCDSVNLSLGTSVHGFCYNDYYAEMLDNLQNTDIVLVTAGSNVSNYATYDYNIGYLYGDEVNFHTGGAPGTYFNTLNVSSVDNIGMSGQYFKIGDKMYFYNEYFPTYYGMDYFNTLAGEKEYVFIEGHALRDEVDALGREVLEGKIFICSRGTNSFYEKANFAVDNGAIGTIIYNNQAGTIGLQMNGYQYTNPAVSITQEEGAMIKAASTPVTDEEGNVRYYTGTINVGAYPGSAINESEYTKFSDFTSWGIPGSLILKPEISAPGGNIYSLFGSTPDGGGSDQYENMSGTSMAAPQISGMVAVLSQYITKNNLAEKTGLSPRKLAQSLLMSTAVPAFEEASGGNYWSVLLQGSGLANIGHAVNANTYIMMGEDATEFAADGKVKAELGDDPEKTGSYNFSFTLNDLTGNGGEYTLSADFFTQDIFEHEGEMYLDTWTTFLPMDIRFTVDGKLYIPTSSRICDLNKDGATNAADAQIILNYAAGLLNEIDSIADQDGDSKVTSYDAYVLLTNLETAAFTVPKDGKVEITISAEITESAKAYLDASYVNGAYVEGFVYVNPCANDEGAVEDVVHSIPVIGFYGNWTDPSMYEGLRFVDNYYGNLRQPHTPYTETNGMTLKYNKEKESSWFTGNPSIVEDVYPANRTAMNSRTTIFQYQLTLVRNASALAFMAVNGDNEVVWISEVTNDVYSPWYDTSWGMWGDVGLWFNINIRPAMMGLKENDTFTFMAVAIPEYYRDGAPLTADDIVRLYNEGALGEGAFMKDTFVVDDTAPEVSSIARDLLTDNLVITATDNQYIAGILVTDLDGNVLAKTVPEQNAANETVTVSVDLSFVEKLGKVNVVVTDYAYNRSTYTVQAGDDTTDPFANRLYAFTTGTQLGNANRWMEIDREHLSYCNVQFSSGMTNLDNMDMTVVAAEYLEGYVFMFDDDGVMYVAEHPNFDDYIAVGATGIDEIFDVAFNYSDNTLYAIGVDNKIYSIDIGSGKATYLYRIYITNPRDDDETESEYLRTLAIDADGNFYSISARGTNRTFLYRWDNSMVNDKGRITPLAPVNNTKTGTLGYNTRDSLQSMAWDYTTNTLYWANNIDWYNRYLLKIDPETGKASPCNQNGNQWGDTQYDGKMYEQLQAIFIVPGGADSGSRLPVADEATGITLAPTSKTVLCGAIFRLNASVTPWNLEDKTMIWTTSDDSVVTVDQEGNVHAVAVGTAVVTVTAATNRDLSASCTVTVDPFEEVKLSGVIHDNNGTVNFAEFTSASTREWKSMGTTDINIQAGALFGDELIVHDGKHMYSIDPESLVATDLGEIAATWRWSDATFFPGQEDMFGTDMLAALCNNGTMLELIDPATGSLSYLDLSSTVASDDPMAAIAYKGSGIHDNGIYPAQYLYVLNESGSLWIVEFWYFADLGIMIEQEYLGRVALDLTDVSYLTTGQYASMYLDETTGYLFLSVYMSGKEAHLYAIDPDTFDLLDLGTFGAGNHPVVSLYQFEVITELTVLLDSYEENLYAGNTVQLNATVKPWYLEGGVTWSSGDETIATVDENGVVTGVAAGDVIITATSKDLDEEGKPATAQCTVHVKSTDCIAADLYAFVQTADGSGQWVTFNGSDIRTLTTQHISDTQILDGVGHNGKIYTETAEGLMIIDPETYGAGEAIQNANNYTFLDMASAPGISYTGAYIPGIGQTDVIVFDNIFYISAEGTMGFFMEFEKGTMMTQWEGWWPFFDNDIAACTCIGETTLNGAEAMAFHIIDVKGKVYGFVAAPMAWDENGVATTYAAGIPSIIGETDLRFSDREAVTMTYIDNGATKGHLIADSANNEVNIYFIDITGTEYATDWVGTIPGITSLTALFTKDELIRAPETLEQNSNNVLEEYAYRDGTANTLSSKFHVSQEYQTPALSSAESAGDDGCTIRTADTVTGERIRTQSAIAEITDGKVAVTITEKVDSHNGIVTVTYDPAVLTYASVASTAVLTAVNVNEKAGTVTIGYATNAPIQAESTIAILNFTYKAEYINTQVSVSTAERNQDLHVKEDSDVLTLVHEVGGHNYQVMEEVKATCLEGGYKIYTCTRCGEFYREELAPLGHDYSAEVTAPTCTEMGYTTYVCANCGDSYTDDYVSPIDHSYTQTVTEPTCTGHGYTTHTCTVCGHSFVTDYTAPIDHSFGPWETVTESGCDTKGQEKRVCACGETEYRDVDPAGHTYEILVIEPTCITAGYTEHICTVCGDSYVTDVVDPTEHSYEAIVTAPTCTESGYTTYICTVCGDSDITDDVPATGHSFGNWVVTTAPTCTEAGIETRYCQSCDVTETRAVEPYCPSAQFTDVALDSWFHEAVDYVVAKGIMNGMSETAFAPNGTTTRAQLVTVLYRLAGSPATELTEQFTDVKADAWYAEAVAWAYAEGITTGLTDTLFAPEQSVTREQVVTFLYRYARFAGVDTTNDGDLSGFGDADTVSDYAAEAMTWAVDAGIITGMDENTLAPRGTCIRAQIATILMRFMELDQ